MPATRATSAPGMRRANRLNRRIPTIEPMPRAAAYGLTSSRFSTIETTFWMIVAPRDAGDQQDHPDHERERSAERCVRACVRARDRPDDRGRHDGDRRAGGDL